MYWLYAWLFVLALPHEPAVNNCLSSCVHAGCGKIGDEGCKALAEGLKINHNLTSINLSSTHRYLHQHTQLPRHSSCAYPSLLAPTEAYCEQLPVELCACRVQRHRRRG
eukprot:105368-Pleurochrysis_carterae.AAC.1